MNQTTRSTTELSSRDVLDKHYNRLAIQYDNFLYYSDDFVRTLTSRMIEMLDLQPDDRMVDLGCGTGIYSRDILKQVELKHPIVGVDPFESMLEQIPDDVPMERVAQDALAFTTHRRDYDKVLIKETVHHIEQRDELFRNLFERISTGGKLLLVHVPPDVQYPLFQKALEKCRSWHANPDQLEKQLAHAGFAVTRDVVEIPLSLPKEHYFAMVESCYMSALSSFNEAELADGLAEMRETHADREILEFPDRFDFLLASKT